MRPSSKPVPPAAGKVAHRSRLAPSKSRSVQLVTRSAKRSCPDSRNRRRSPALYFSAARKSRGSGNAPTLAAGTSRAGRGTRGSGRRSRGGPARGGLPLLDVDALGGATAAKLRSSALELRPASGAKRGSRNAAAVAFSRTSAPSERRGSSEPMQPRSSPERRSVTNVAAGVRARHDERPRRPRQPEFRSDRRTRDCQQGAAEIGVGHAGLPVSVGSGR